MNVLREISSASRDIKLLWASVFFRLFAYGLTNQVLTLFLNGINLEESEIGVFMSLTLIGDVLCSYVLTWYADSWGRRRILVYGSVMMVLSGIAFAYSENFHVLLFFAIIGVISPSSDEVGPFKSVEESMIAHLTPNNRRPEVYAIHALVGTTGAALGAIACGAFIDVVKYTGMYTEDLQCYKLVFLVYALLAFVKVIIMLFLSDRTELDCDHAELSSPEALIEDEMAPLMQSAEQRNRGLSKDTKSILIKLLVIFMVDSLGMGFMTSGWMVYYYAKQFLMSSFALGTLFFVSKIVTASSTIPSSAIAKTLGPVKATLLVQVASGVFSILIPLAHNCLPLSILLLNLHFATTAMDVTPRQILLTNLIMPQDLTKVMGVVNIGKTLARCVGPVFTGLLASADRLWLCYVISGGLVICADCLLAFWFLHVDLELTKQLNS
ncbi:hypothetical protein HG536_0F00650 [Torulaspora globosa]|uniref:Major facilitator superfamily (MFS) profile domain-containing protein n=1 Tax=Torulaspora globosa TaxID=48254 RepID=A0A7G3ZJQ4_9SACH|nr:uncharacterized protein HG536_0F00650 [Torulaspora globosa]QLL33740.1 hypothetical protein HG536_0F00650 [Torulaspora globosa]